MAAVVAGRRARSFCGNAARTRPFDAAGLPSGTSTTEILLCALAVRVEALALVAVLDSGARSPCRRRRRAARGRSRVRHQRVRVRAAVGRHALDQLRRARVGDVEDPHPLEARVAGAGPAASSRRPGSCAASRRRRTAGCATRRRRAASPGRRSRRSASARRVGDVDDLEAVVVAGERAVAPEREVGVAVGRLEARSLDAPDHLQVLALALRARRVPAGWWAASLSNHSRGGTARERSQALRAPARPGPATTNGAQIARVSSRYDGYPWWPAYPVARGSHLRMIRAAGVRRPPGCVVLRPTAAGGRRPGRRAARPRPTHR